MTKATWQGYIALGQLGIPVRLYSATQSSKPQFTLLHKPDNSPVERVLRCSAEQKDIPYDEVVRAAEYDGKYITLTGDEIERAGTEPIKTIRVKQFCSIDEVDYLYFEKPYYIVPNTGGERAYALMREVFTRNRTAAVVQYILHNKEHVGVVAVHGDMLVLHQLRFSADLVPRTDIKTPPLPKPSPSEVEALGSVVDRYSSPFYIQDYHDEHSEKVHELIERKAKGLGAPRHKRIAPHATPEDQIVAALHSTLQEGAPSLPAVQRPDDRMGLL